VKAEKRVTKLGTCTTAAEEQDKEVIGTTTVLKFFTKAQAADNIV